MSSVGGAEWRGGERRPWEVAAAEKGQIEYGVCCLGSIRKSVNSTCDFE